jgi:hypothetical protein
VNHTERDSGKAREVRRRVRVHLHASFLLHTYVLTMDKQPIDIVVPSEDPKKKKDSEDKEDPNASTVPKKEDKDAKDVKDAKDGEELVSQSANAGCSPVLI